MFTLLLALTAYTYSYHDWLNLPVMDEVVSITTDKFDAYVAVPGGVYEISVADGSLTRTITRADGIKGEVRAVGWDSQYAMLWILSTGNVLNISPFSNQSFSYELPDPDVSSLGIARDYVLLAFGNRYWQVQKQTGIITETQPGNRDIAWFGSRTPYAATDFTFLTPWLLYDRQLQSHRITTVYPDGRRLWVGTEGFGVFLYSLASKQQLKHWQFGPSGSVYRMFRLSDGLWFRGENQSVRYDPAGDSWSYFATPFNALINDPALVLRSKVLNLGWRETILAAAGDSSLLWLGTDQGIYTYQARADVLARQFRFSIAGSSPSPGSQSVNDILLDRDSVFVATDNGIISYDRKSGGWSVFSDSLTQSYFGVFGIGATSRRRYYAVYGGLETRDSSGEPELVIPPGFNVGTHPHALAGAGGKLFVATGNGIMVYHEPLRTWQTLTTESGLPDSEIRSLYADDQWLWVVTPAGISRFNYHALFP